MRCGEHPPGERRRGDGAAADDPGARRDRRRAAQGGPRQEDLRESFSEAFEYSIVQNKRTEFV